MDKIELVFNKKYVVADFRNNQIVHFADSKPLKQPIQTTILLSIVLPITLLVILDNNPFK